MTTYVLTYDLNKEDRLADHKPLIDELKRLGAHRYQASAWLANLKNTPSQVHAHFTKLMDSNDSLWVSEFTKNYMGTELKPGTVLWLQNNQPAR